MEVVTGMVAIVMLLGATIALVLQLSRQRRYDQEQYLAFLACCSTLEEIRSLPFTQLAALDNTGFDVRDIKGNPGGLDCVPGDADGLPGHIGVTIDQSAGAEKNYRVVLSVQWRGAQKNGHYRLQTLLGERKVE